MGNSIASKSHGRLNILSAEDFSNSIMKVRFTQLSSVKSTIDRGLTDHSPCPNSSKSESFDWAYPNGGQSNNVAPMSRLEDFRFVRDLGTHDEEVERALKMSSDQRRKEELDLQYALSTLEEANTVTQYLEDEQKKDKAIVLKEFHCFRELPIELRLKIWEFTRDTSRILAILPYFIDPATKKQLRFQCYSKAPLMLRYVFYLPIDFSNLLPIKLYEL